MFIISFDGFHFKIINDNACSQFTRLGVKRPSVKRDFWMAIAYLAQHSWLNGITKFCYISEIDFLTYRN